MRAPIPASDDGRGAGPIRQGPALVAYLGQPDASPAVCDLRARGPHVVAFTPEIRDALVDGLVDGKIDAALWRRCVDGALKGLPADQVASMFDGVMRAYGKLLKDSDVETEPALAARVATMQRLYVDAARVSTAIQVFWRLCSTICARDSPRTSSGRLPEASRRRSSPPSTSSMAPGRAIAWICR